MASLLYVGLRDVPCKLFINSRRPLLAGQPPPRSPLPTPPPVQPDLHFTRPLPAIPAPLPTSG